MSNLNAFLAYFILEKRVKNLEDALAQKNMNHSLTDNCKSRDASKNATAVAVNHFCALLWRHFPFSTDFFLFLLHQLL